MMKAYRKYKLNDVGIVEQYRKDNPGVFVQWQPYTFAEFCDKAFDIDDSVFMEKFDTWFDEAKIEYRDEVTDSINEGHLRDGL